VKLNSLISSPTRSRICVKSKVTTLISGSMKLNVVSGNDTLFIGRWRISYSELMNAHMLPRDVCANTENAAFPAVSA